VTHSATNVITAPILVGADVADSTTNAITAPTLGGADVADSATSVISAPTLGGAGVADRATSIITPPILGGVDVTDSATSVITAPILGGDDVADSATSTPPTQGAQGGPGMAAPSPPGGSIAAALTRRIVAVLLRAPGGSMAMATLSAVLSRECRALKQRVAGQRFTAWLMANPAFACRQQRDGTLFVHACGSRAAANPALYGGPDTEAEDRADAIEVRFHIACHVCVIAAGSPFPLLVECDWCSPPRLT